MDYKSKLELILAHYEYLQIVKAMEELGELIVELAKIDTANTQEWGYDLNKVVEEIADVEVMLEQLKILFGINQDRLQAIKESKVNRTIERME